MTGGHPLELNENGFRGPIIPYQKQQDEIRILALGDSVTFGTGVAVKDSWPMQLQRELQKLSPNSVSVVNTAIPATTIQDITYAVKNVWNQYHVISRLNRFYEFFNFYSPAAIGCVKQYSRQKKNNQKQ